MTATEESLSLLTREIKNFSEKYFKLFNENNLYYLKYGGIYYA